MNELEQEIKGLIVEVLKLDELGVDDFDATTPLFGSGVGLDSLDALEIAMALSKRYGVRPGSDEAKNRTIFANVASIARFVAAERTQAVPTQPQEAV